MLQDSSRERPATRIPGDMQSFNSKFVGRVDDKISLLISLVCFDSIAGTCGDVLPITYPDMSIH